MAIPQTVLITGCSDGGIGSAQAIAFQERGLHVFATARDPSKMKELADRTNITLLKLDVTSSDEIAHAVKDIEGETGGRLDYLINNAGRNHFMPLLDESIEAATQIFQTNVWGTLAVTQAFAPLVIKAKGTIVNNCSISGHLNIPWMGTYAASKRSMEIMSETLRLELAPFGVKVVALVTMAVETQGLTHFDDFQLPSDSVYKSIEDTIKSRAHGAGAPRKDTPHEFAEKVVPLILKGANGKLWPGKASIVGFIANYFPTWLQDILWAKGTGVGQLGSQ